MANGSMETSVGTVTHCVKVLDRLRQILEF
jgi:hypothetical protein